MTFLVGKEMWLKATQTSWVFIHSKSKIPENIRGRNNYDEKESISHIYILSITHDII